MCAHPHISVTATVQSFLRSIKAKRDLEWTREQSVAATYLAQSVQTPPLELRSQALQRLLGMERNFEFRSASHFPWTKSGEAPRLPRRQRLEHLPCIDTLLSQPHNGPKRWL